MIKFKFVELQICSYSNVNDDVENLNLTYVEIKNVSNSSFVLFETEAGIATVDFSTDRGSSCLLERWIIAVFMTLDHRFFTVPIGQGSRPREMGMGNKHNLSRPIWSAEITWFDIMNPIKAWETNKSFVWRYWNRPWHSPHGCTLPKEVGSPIPVPFNSSLIW